MGLGAAGGRYEVPISKIQQLMGMGGDNLLPEAIHVEKDTDEGKKLSRRCAEIFEAKYLAGIQPFPAAKALVEKVSADNYQVTVASSGNAAIVDKMIAIVDIAALLSTKADSPDAKKSKPNPDIILATLDKLVMRPEETLMLGDTPYDISATGKAGVGVIALRCGGFTDEELKGAVAIYNDAADLLANHDSSPLKRSA